MSEAKFVIAISNLIVAVKSGNESKIEKCVEEMLKIYKGKTSSSSEEYYDDRS
jgi:hypothetical protein